MNTLPRPPFLLHARDVPRSRRPSPRGFALADATAGGPRMFKDGRLTKYGQTMVLVFMLVLTGFATAIYLKVIEREGQDSTGAILGVLGIVSAIAVAAINLNQNKRNEDLLHGQNETLAKIETTTATANPEADALRDELKNQRHTFNNVLNYISNRLTEVETELRAEREKTMMLEAQARAAASVAEKLADKAPPATTATEPPKA